MNIKRIPLSILFVLTVLVLLSAVFVVDGTSAFAFAEETVTVSEVTCQKIGSFNKDGEAQYEKVAYTEGYARDINVTFSVQGAAYYTVFALEEGQSEQEGLKIETVPADGIITFAVEKTGIYTVTCRVFDIGENYLSEKSITVKSDYDKPIAPTSNVMNDWVAYGTTFQAEINWTPCQDILSGVKKIFYRIKYDDTEKTDWKEIDTDVEHTVLSFTKSGTVETRCYDNAGNCTETSFAYKKFDCSDPIEPSYTISPSLEQGKYASSYAIRLTFPEDNESGLSDKQYYIMNGTTYEYDGDILLNVKKSYSFVFYSLDKVGNRSEYVSLEIPSGYFDTQQPLLDRFQSEIDLRNKNGICLVTFTGDDYKESGIAVAAVKDTTMYFSRQNMTAYDLFSLRYDCFTDTVLTVEVSDNAGNKAVNVFSILYFDRSAVVTAVQEIVRLYRDADFTKCTQKTQEKIENALIAVNNLLNTSGNTEKEIVSACETAKSLFQTVATTSYKIESVPTYVSSIIRYTVQEEDFGAESFGNEITVILNADENDSINYLAKTGWDKGFCDLFTLTYLLNGEESCDLTKGLTIKMNLPTDYLDRNFVLINRLTGDIVETTRINNSIEFTMKNTTSYALVISGELAAKKVTPVEEVKTIAVFGRTWPLSTFLWLVCGTIGGAVLLVAAIIIVMLIKRK